MLGIALAAVLLTAGTGWTYPPYGTGAMETGRVVPEDIYWAVPAADVLIDAGHGGVDGGTHYGDIMEKDINLAIAKKLYLILRSYKVRAVLNRTGDYALSDDNRWHAVRSRHRRDLSQRRSLTDEIEARMFVSIHVNWADSRDRGALVIHRREGRSALLAAMIQGSLNRLQGNRTLHRPSNKFYLLNHVKAPSVIVETAFLSHPADRAMLTSKRGQTRIAEAIAAGIIAYRCFAP
ncbi:N-acetylmuramoyl-L-alanine amidase [Cohnella pontilimi]|uniref:N-acetylmuramoyl-L-alanine amidase n=2 Tax=Cohnella pontilimi TaxID=2564100 RepID=A0A4V5LS32_9BACL|nr:N-acetylmuramoyl-L-alanine amidase [Cohnella pontilimi]